MSNSKDYIDVSRMIIDKLDDEFLCEIFLSKIKWGETPKCPKCSNETNNTINVRGQFDCKTCHKQFSIRHNSYLEKSHLDQIYVASYLIIEESTTSYKLSQQINVTPKTAISLIRKIKDAFLDDNDFYIMKFIIQRTRLFFDEVLNLKNQKRKLRYSKKRILKINKNAILKYKSITSFFDSNFRQT